MLYAVNKDYGKVIDLESCVPDGRLTGPTDGKVFNYREMLKVVKSLGRPLTNEEAEKYRIR